MPSPTLTVHHDIVLNIGEMPILVRTDSSDFARMLSDRYGEFVSADGARPVMQLEIRLIQEPGEQVQESEVRSPKSENGTRDSGLGARERQLSTPNSQLPNPNSLFPNSDSQLSNPEFPSPESRVPNSDALDPDADVSVRLESGRWIMERGDFRAEWNPESRKGWVRQTLNPYSIDGVLRILHSLILAREGGLLVHAASAVRNGRAFLFAGVSETGKTTISRLAPPDVTLLTDEISYLRGVRRQEAGVGRQETEVGSRELGVGIAEFEVRSSQSEDDSKFEIQDSRAVIETRKSKIETGKSKFENRNSKIESGKSKFENRNSKIEDSESRVPEFPNPEFPNPEFPNPEFPSPESPAPAFLAFGTPFAGELARIGQKMQAPLDTLFLLQQGPENRIEAVGQGQAVRELMRHILFFAHDPELVELVFQTVCDLVRQVPVKRLIFKKDASVWKLIG